MNSWKPIDTANDDHIKVLLWVRGRHGATGHATIGGRNASDEWEYDNGKPMGDFNAYPTHWMPLPGEPRGDDWCETCDGTGLVQMSYTVARCCGRQMENGDCCGSPEPELQVETEKCPDCETLP